MHAAPMLRSRRDSLHGTAGGETGMTEALKGVGAITLFVTDPQRSKEFYGRALDLAVVYEDDVAATLRMDNLLLNLLKESEASELIEPVKPGATSDGARSMLTIWVADADAECASLTAKGIALLNGPIDR